MHVLWYFISISKVHFQGYNMKSSNASVTTSVTSFTGKSVFHLWFWQKINIFYEACSENNASYFITSIHDIEGRYWWCGSRGWTFLQIRCYMLPCDRWQQKGSLTKWRLTWKCGWSKDMSLNSSIDIHQHLLNAYGHPPVEVSTVRQWVACFNSGDSGSGSPSLAWILWAQHAGAHGWKKNA